MSDRRAVVVGGSVAATTAARGLRLGGWDGEIVLLSEERHPAYARPPLSKGVLTGSETPDSANLPPLEDVDVRAGVRATALDPGTKAILLDDGDTLAYESMIIATGARARTLPGAYDAGAYMLRTLDDALALNVALTAASSAIIVGGGPLGMEVASAGIALGCATTVVAQTPPLELQLGPFIAQRLVTAARAAGVEIVSEPSGATVINDQGTAVRLADGRTLRADVVVVAVGCQPNIEWLTGSGLDLRGGVVVDAYLQAADGVHAAGDVVAFPDGTSRARAPFWTNASEQAMTAAHNVLHPDDQRPHRARPHFWTDQFGMKIKVCGRASALHGDHEIVEENAETGSTVVRWRRDGLLAAATINHPMPLPKIRKLLTA